MLKKLFVCGMLLALMLFALIPAGAEEAAGYDTLFFGRYEQDNDPENGPEPVEWLILDRQDGRALLLSRFALEAHRFHTRDVKVQWDKCQLREWMGTEMFSALFTPEEQEAVLLTHLTAEKHPRFHTDPGGDTDDRIFLLSIQEVEKYFPDQASRTVQPTPYARLTTHAHVEKNGNTGWWLRTTGHSADDEARVSSIGKFINFQVNWRFDTVRPALWVDLMLLPDAESQPS